MREIDEARRKEGREFVGHAEPHRARGALLPRQRLDEFVMRGDQLAAVFQHRAAARAQGQARGVVEHRRADQLLQPPDLQRDGRLRAPELLGGAGEAAAVDNRNEGSDDVDGKRAHGIDLTQLRFSDRGGLTAG